MKQNKGFSLVETAVVIAVIGVLATGVLMGLRLVENSRIKSFISQVTFYENAAKSFYSQYKTWPGDFAQAEARLKECGVDPVTGLDRQCRNGNGDHIVASSAGGNACRMPAFNAGNVDTPFPCAPAPGASVANGNETIQFWRHLQLAGLINGLRMRPTTYNWGDSMPKVKLAGGLQVIYNGDPNNQFVASDVVGAGLTGHFFVLGRNARLFNRNFQAVGDGVLSVNSAWALDREMDDGTPQTGDFRTLGGWGCGEPVTPGIPLTPLVNVYGGGDGNRQCTSLYRFTQ
jgi:prepilin-type N-terminal cleavage/methylation domain-containing protein